MSENDDTAFTTARMSGRFTHIRWLNGKELLRPSLLKQRASSGLEESWTPYLVYPL